MSNISTGMSLIIFFRKSTDITLRIAALSPMLLKQGDGRKKRMAKQKSLKNVTRLLLAISVVIFTVVFNKMNCLKRDEVWL